MIAPLLIAALAALVTASAELSSSAALDSSRVLGGELWRLFSGHLAHLSWRHFLMDAPIFVALYASFSRRSTPSCARRLMLFASLPVSLTVMTAGMHQVYGGLSGLSCAAVSALLLGMILDRPSSPLPYLLAGAFCHYLFSLEGVASGIAVAHEAHLAGTFCGGLFVLVTRRRAEVPLLRDIQVEGTGPAPLLLEPPLSENLALLARPVAGNLHVHPQ